MIAHVDRFKHSRYSQVISYPEYKICRTIGYGPRDIGQIEVSLFGKFAENKGKVYVSLVVLNSYSLKMAADIRLNGTTLWTKSKCKFICKIKKVAFGVLSRHQNVGMMKLYLPAIYGPS